MSVMDITASDAISDPLLFGPFFDGPRWAVWRSVSKAVFAEPMSAQDLAAFKGVAGGREPPPRRVREFVAAIGRGGGKDSYASFLAAYLAMTFDPRGKLRPGERAYILCIAVDKEQAAIATIGTSSIELTNGVTIQVIVNSHRAVGAGVSWPAFSMRRHFLGTRTAPLLTRNCTRLLSLVWRVLKEVCFV
jgi:hypothetical protein